MGRKPGNKPVVYSTSQTSSQLNSQEKRIIIKYGISLLLNHACMPDDGKGLFQDVAGTEQSLKPLAFKF
jgi:hypothetical protein